MQTSVENAMAIGLPGMLADSGYKDVASYINNVKQLIAVTITAIDLETTLTLNGVAFTVNVGGGSRTKTQLRDDLIAAINAGSEPVTSSIKDDDELYVEADVSGTAFTSAGTANCSVVTTIANQTNVPFGVFVCQDADIPSSQDNDQICRLPIAAADITTARLALGVALHSQAIEQALVNANNLGYEPQSAISVLRRGRVIVQVEDAVVAGGAVYVRHTASGANTQLGAFRSDDDSSTAGLLANARYKTGASAGGLAVLEISLP